MTDSQDERLANTLGALVVGLYERLRLATEAAAGQRAAGPAALVELHDLLAGRTIDDLRRSVALTPSGGVRLVDRLEGEGYVERRPGADARSLALWLTPKGRRAARRVRRARAEALLRSLAVLTEAERTQLSGIVDKLVAEIVSDRLAGRAAGTVPAGGWLCRLCDPQACGRAEGSCPAEQTSRAFVESRWPVADQPGGPPPPSHGSARGRRRSRDGNS